MDRNQRVAIAEETSAILTQKSYIAKIGTATTTTTTTTNHDDNEKVENNTLLVDLSQVLEACCHGTQFHRADEILALPQLDRRKSTNIYMTKESTLECLQRLQKETCDEDIFVLNFASAKNPGGGFHRRGSWEQEEYLAAATGLLSSLSTSQAQPFYEFHKEQTRPGKTNIKSGGLLLYSSNMIYSPYVPVFRTAADMKLSSQPYTCNIISSSCVNYNTGMLSKKVSKEDEESAVLLMQSRVLRVMQVAAYHGATTLILGPWGCGINKNSPREVAKAFSGALLHPDMDGRFETVVFAVPYDESTNVYKYFSKSFDVRAIGSFYP